MTVWVKLKHTGRLVCEAFLVKWEGQYNDHKVKYGTTQRMRI